MTAEKLGIFPSEQIQNSQSRIVLPQRRCEIAADPCPKSGFPDHPNFLVPHHPQQSIQFQHQWGSNSHSSVGVEPVEDDDDDDDDEDDEVVVLREDNNLENVVTVGSNSGSNQDEIFGFHSKSYQTKNISAFGIKGSILGKSGNESNNSSGVVRNAGGEIYHRQYLNGGKGPSSSSRQKDIVVLDDGCGFSGRKEGSYYSESGDSLRVILSDPLTGTLMDDAMILPCGHSFSANGGIHQVMRTKACCTCSQPVSDNSIAPNLTLREAVKAFRQEEDMQVKHPSKRRRERYEWDKGTCGDFVFSDHQRGKGLQFPFVVTDRVIIKGNKRTPQRFVGREAIVTTQCLNGWYVVKTLDNAESVKLQYRSLAKVGGSPSSEVQQPVRMGPNWL